MLKKTLNLESKTSDKNLKSVNGDGVEGGIRSGWDRPGHLGEGVRCSGEQVGGKTHTGRVKSHSSWGKTHRLGEKSLELGNTHRLGKNM